MKHLALLGVLLSFAVAPARAEPTIFIVRHAEKAAVAPDNKDPDLSEAGRARAEALARILRDVKIETIYVTEFKRTQETAAPLARLMSLNPITIQSADRAALIEKLKGASGDVLVVGHGNTIGEIIKKLGIDTPIEIAENDYDNLFVITLGEKPRLLRLHF